ncbi:hypothetical protein [Phaeodactylibacter luteus]|uniref:Capsule assembly Wzi family protein n=1 Tax=Phaeodactylibacter luteus TaxID=1564516 RepID=A0A5C6S342_9BACT|nr:hypothetical protein [Phaeodactylibacter luteus]TXB68359.1 hypothetical protein FRY97_02975 [Phaeodactylibacter luteus]
MRYLYSSLFVLCAVLGVQAQDLGQLQSPGRPALSGNIQLSSQAYQSSGEGLARSAPFGVALSGGLTASFAGISIPITFSFAQQQGALSSPFNQFGMSPYYKWAKLHLGYRTLRLSPYVFSGRSFLGAGIELTPGKFKVIAFRGRMRNLLSVQPALGIEGPVVLPSYERMASGAKVGYGGPKAGVDISAAFLQDRREGAADSTFLPPMENLVLGVHFYARFFRRLRLEANIAGSAFTPNQQAGFEEALPQELERYGLLLSPNISTRASWAGDASLSYNHRGVSVGLKYQQVAPFFQSFGINFLQNDVENYTINFAAPLLGKRLRLQGSLGIQRDNLNEAKAFQSQRVIGAFSAAWHSGQRLHLMARYANYQHENRSGLVNINDTLQFVTITQHAFAGGQWKAFERGPLSGSLQLNGFFNDIVNESLVLNGAADFSGHGASGSFTLRHETMGWNLGPVFNYHHYLYPGRKQGRTGGGLSAGQSLFGKKLQVALSALYNLNRTNGERSERQLNLSAQINARLKGGHGIRLRTFFLNRAPEGGEGFRESRALLAYQYSFHTPKPKQ